MSKESEALKRLCTDENRIKDTYYGSIYRASFTLLGEKADWDIFHIGIPFDPQKEAELLRRFGLERDELPGFYGNFEKAVVRHIKITKSLNTLSIPAIQKSLVEYKSVQYFPRKNKEGRQVGQDFYFISKPMESFVGTDIIKANGAYLLDINNLLIRLLQTAKSCNENGFSLGAIDLDSCFYASDDSGKKFLKLAYGYYSESDNVHPEAYTEDVRHFIDEELLDGAKQSLDSDVRMICAYIWTMLDGRHYTEANQNAWMAKKFYADAPEKFPTDLMPRYAPPEIAALLVQGMAQGSEAMRVLQTDIRKHNKRISAGELENPYITFEAPSYLSKPLPELRVDEVGTESEPEAEEEKAGTEESGRAQKKKVKWGGLVVAALAILFLAGGGLYMLLGADGISAILHPKHYTMSSRQNIYVADGNIVTDKLTVYESLMLDADGNIVLAASPEEILYPKEYVSEYIFVDNVQLSIVEKKFSRAGILKQEDQIFRDEVVDLRKVDGLIYDYSATADNRIAKSVVDRYHVEENSIILMRDDYDNEQSYAIVMLIDMTNAPTEPEWTLEEQPDSTEIVLGESTEAEDQTEVPGIYEESYPVREIEGFTNDNLYKMRGEWKYTVQVEATPANAINGRVTLTSSNSDFMYFIVKSEDGKESKAKSIRLRANAQTPETITVIGTVEGKFTIQIVSDDGAVAKRAQMTFARPNDYPEIKEPVRPTPTPIPTPQPDPTPTPEITPVPTPEPTPVPTQDTSQYYAGGGSGGGYTGGPTTVTITPPPVVQPTPMPAATPAPIYTPEPVMPLTCYVSTIDLPVGGTYRLGDYLDGIEYGYVMAIPSPSGIVSIDQSAGFLITGLTPGQCVITISKDAESVYVTVNVS